MGFPFRCVGCEGSFSRFRFLRHLKLLLLEYFKGNRGIRAKRRKGDGGFVGCYFLLLTLSVCLFSICSLPKYFSRSSSILHFLRDGEPTFFIYSFGLLVVTAADTLTPWAFLIFLM